jgi:hypothetical protein
MPVDNPFGPPSYPFDSNSTEGNLTFPPSSESASEPVSEHITTEDIATVPAVTIPPADTPPVEPVVESEEKDKLEEELTKAEILAKFNNMESNIPVTHPYWGMK